MGILNEAWSAGNGPIERVEGRSAPDRARYVQINVATRQRRQVRRVDHVNKIRSISMKLGSVKNLTAGELGVERLPLGLSCICPYWP